MARPELLRNARTIHFVGIGGSGMSPLARIMAQRGHRITGSDLHHSAVTTRLERAGIKISIGHEPENVSGADAVVVSTAIESSNPEVLEAAGRGLPIFHRSEVLEYLTLDRVSVGVTGTHGKTTLTAMIGHVLDAMGFAPTVVAGAEFDRFEGGAGVGEGKYLVFEADESDRSFVRYRVDIAAVTAVEPDHLEFYSGNYGELKRAYLEFLQNIRPRGKVVICTDSSEAADLARECSKEVITFGLRGKPDYAAVDVRLGGTGSESTAMVYGSRAGVIRLSVPGMHNVINAVGCLAVCSCLSSDTGGILAALSSFRGVKRRFEILGEFNGIMLVDDYAHHPTEVRTVLETAKAHWPERRLIAVFQPHRYTRTRFLWDEFIKCFDPAEILVLTDIYSPPPERPVDGIDSERLARAVESRHPGEVLYVPNRYDIPAVLLDMVEEGDVVVVMGAGDISYLAPQLQASLQLQEPKAHSARGEHKN